MERWSTLRVSVTHAVIHHKWKFYHCLDLDIHVYCWSLVCGSTLGCCIIVLTLWPNWVWAQHTLFCDYLQEERDHPTLLWLVTFFPSFSSFGPWSVGSPYTVLFFLVELGSSLHLPTSHFSNLELIVSPSLHYAHFSREGLFGDRVVHSVYIKVVLCSVF